MATPIAKFMPIIRWVVLGWLLLSAVVLLGTNAHYINTTLHSILFIDGFQAWPQASPDAFAAFNVAIAVITIVVVTPMIVIDALRAGAVTSYIVFELSVLGLIDIFWLVTGAWTADIYAPIGNLCSINTDVSVLQGACHDLQAGMAFSWLGWIFLFAYLITLLVLAIMSGNKGHSVWKATVRDAGVPNNAPIPAYPSQNAMHEQVPLSPGNVKLADAPFAAPQVPYGSPYSQQPAGVPGYRPTEV